MGMGRFPLFTIVAASRLYYDVECSDSLTPPRLFREQQQQQQQQSTQCRIMMMIYSVRYK